MSQIESKLFIKVDLITIVRINMDNTYIMIRKGIKVYSFKGIIKMIRDMDMALIVIIRSK